MKRAKKPKQRGQKYLVSEKQLERIKSKVTDDVTKKALLLFLAAAADEIGLTDEIGQTDEQVCNVFETANRYGRYIDEHLAKIQQLQETIEKGTGIKIAGW